MSYYTSLSAVRALFSQGNPIVTYHKLGPRPGGTRIKGLYMSASLFSKQIQELRAAGYINGTLPESTGARVKSTVVITFDDGYLNVLQHALGPLAAANFRAVQFLVADLLGKRNEWDIAAGEAPEPLMDPKQVREWLAAGHGIGSHSLSHPYLTRIPRAQAIEEIRSSKMKLEDLFGCAIQHFCYPYGDWNEAVRDCVSEAGYQTACTTDYGVNGPETSPFALKRLTARYASRNLKNAWRWLNDRVPAPHS